MIFRYAKYLWITPLPSFVPMRCQGFCLADGGDTLNRNEAIGVEEAFDHDQCAGRQFALEDAATYLDHGWEIFNLGYGSVRAIGHHRPHTQRR